MAKVIKISIFLLELFPNEGYVAWRESKCRPGCANFANAFGTAYCTQYKMHHNHDIHMMHIMQNKNIARRTKCTMHVCKRYKRRAHVGPIVCAPPPPQSETIRCQLTIVSNEFVRSTFDGKSHLCVYYCTDKISEAVLYFC